MAEENKIVYPDFSEIMGSRKYFAEFNGINWEIISIRITCINISMGRDLLVSDGELAAKCKYSELSDSFDEARERAIERVKNGAIEEVKRINTEARINCNALRALENISETNKN
ncbi:MAG: hypothetical protein KAS07_03045 [Candidatus Pacebacteria bacterium]|nr:hypothetical protein [Candidatus Paceibacterota bacterium]